WLLVAGGGLGRGVGVDPHAVRSRPLGKVALPGDTVTGGGGDTSAPGGRGVRLGVTDGWLLENERHPGTDNPGRTDLYTLPGEISAGGSKPFSYRPQSPLQNRSDGTFVPSAAVVGYTEIIPPP